MPTPSSPSRYPHHSLSWLLDLSAVVLAPAVATLTLNGLFTRWLADDYCMGEALRLHGFWGAQAWWYRNWTGRFGYIWLVHLLIQLPPWIVPVMLVAAVLGLFAGLWFAVYELLNSRPRTQREAVWPAGVVAFIIESSLLAAAPNLGQSLYWLTGMLTYTLPIIALTIALGISLRAVRRTLRPWELVVITLLIILGGSLSETAAVLQVAVTSLALAAYWIVYWLHRRRSKVPGLKNLPIVLWLSWLAAILTTAVVAAAPGNAVRQQAVGPKLGLLLSVRESFSQSLRFCYHLLAGHPAIVAVVLIGGIAVGLVTGRKYSWRTALLAVIVLGFMAYLLNVAMFIPALYASRVAPPDRALFEPVLVGLSAVIAAGFVLGGLINAAFSKPKVRLGLSVILAIVLLAAGWKITTHITRPQLDQVRSNARYASAWDQRDRQIRQAVARGQQQFNLQPLDHTYQLEDITPDPAHWVNRCMKNYYGAGAIIGQ